MRDAASLLISIDSRYSSAVNWAICRPSGVRRWSFWCGPMRSAASLSSRFWPSNDDMKSDVPAEGVESLRIRHTLLLVAEHIRGVVPTETLDEGPGESKHHV